MSDADVRNGRGEERAADRIGDDQLGERKERVLHTRIPESLDREIKRRARGLGMSVSTVVRNVLMNTFDLVENFVNDGANRAMSIMGEQPTPANGILGWQEAILELNAVCERCNAILPAGTTAAIGVHEGHGPRAIICKSCLDRVAAKATAGAAPTASEKQGD